MSSAREKRQNESSPALEVEVLDGYARVVFRGTGNFDAFVEAFGRMINHPEFRPGMNALWDLRNASLARIGTSEMRRMVEWAQRHTPKRDGARVAMLVRRDVDFGVSRIAEPLIEARLSVQYQVFRDEAEALAWVM